MINLSKNNVEMKKPFIYSAIAFVLFLFGCEEEYDKSGIYSVDIVTMNKRMLMRLSIIGLCVAPGGLIQFLLIQKRSIRY